MVRDDWSAITDFTKNSEHPDSPNDTLKRVLENAYRWQEKLQGKAAASAAPAETKSAGSELKA